jgi:hypothetical protein
LPQVFKENGYTTLSVGKVLHMPEDSAAVSWSKPPFHLYEKTHGAGRALLQETVGPFADGKAYGLDEQADVDDFAYGDGQFLKRAIEELGRLKDSDKPFFLACGFMKPHLPFYAPKRYWDLYDREGLTLPDNLTWQEDIPLSEWHIRKAQESRSLHSGEMDEWSEAYYRRLHHGYYACVSYIDSLVGRLLDELERLELAEDTIVILWGDHGFQLGERSLTGKHNTFDLSLRVPVILRVPGSDSVRVFVPKHSSPASTSFPPSSNWRGWRNRITSRASALPVLRRILRRHSATVSIAGSSGLLRFLRRASPTPASMRAARCSSTIRRIWTRKKTSPATLNIRMRCSKCGSCWMRASTSP